MNITIEMIEQVLDATGADYYVVKQTLAECDGNVEEAIKAIKEKGAMKEEDVSKENASKEQDISDIVDETCEYADRVVGRLKERIKEGNVDRIRISREGKTLLDIPVNIGVLGGLVGLMTVPWAVIVGVIMAYGMNCKIEVISSDGKNEDIEA